MTTTYHYDIEQRSEEWYALRRGIVTASNVGKLITSTTPDPRTIGCPACSANAGDPCVSRARREPTEIATVHQVRSALAATLPPVLKAVDKGELPLREAVKLADMPRAEQVSAMVELQAAGATKGAALSNGIAAKKRGEKVERADKSRVRSKKLLEKWLAVVKKEKPNATVPLVDVLKFILGGNVPRDGHAVFELLADAGFKGNKPAKKKAEAA
jgi:hypothetical protein